MKKRYIILAIVCCLNNISSAQISFLRHYEDFSGEGNSLIVNSNGNYIIGTTVWGQMLNDFGIYELNPYGDPLWLQSCGTDTVNKPMQIIQTSDGGYASIGYSAFFTPTYSIIYFVKTDVNGDTLWTKQIGGLGQEQGTAITQLSSGEYMIGGHTAYNTNGLFDFFLVKTNVNGDTVWTKKYGGSQNDKSNSMRPTFDGGYIMAGFSESFTNGMKDFYLVKTDSNGDTLWTRNYGGTLNENINSIRQTSDSGYVMAGYSESFGITSENMFVMKTNSTGDTLWTKTFGQPGRYSWGQDIIQTTDGGYAISGLIKTAAPNGGHDFYLVRLDAAGNWQWEREIKVEPTNTSYTSSEGRSIIQTSDGGFAISGIYFNASTIEVLLVKTDEDGLVGINEINSSNAFNVYPNPSHDYIKIKFNEGYVNSKINLINAEGKIIHSMQNKNANEIQINRNNIASGLYLIQLISSKGDVTSAKVLFE